MSPYRAGKVLWEQSVQKTFRGEKGLEGLIRNLKQYESVQSRKGFMGAERTENLSRRRGLGGLIRNLK
jgi:hypothetical protein